MFDDLNKIPQSSDPRSFDGASGASNNQSNQPGQTGQAGFKPEASGSVPPSPGSASQAGQASPPGGEIKPPAPDSQASRTNNPEDIFADTETSSGPAPKPPVFQPKKNADLGAGGSQAANDAGYSGQSKGKDKKTILIAVGILVVIILAAGGYWAYSKYLANEQAVDQPVEAPTPAPTPTPTPTPAPTPTPTPTPTPQPEPERPEDSDQDGLSDEEERQLGTNPYSVDSDDDGLFDREEVKIYKTDPLNPDTDGDGYLDGDEVKAGYNPLGPGRLFEIE